MYREIVFRFLIFKARKIALLSHMQSSVSLFTPCDVYHTYFPKSVNISLSVLAQRILLAARCVIVPLMSELKFMQLFPYS